MNKVYRIILTGGPCGGKTSCKDAIEKHFTNLGVAVYRVPEAATIFIQGGLNPLQVVVELLDVAGKLLPQRQGYGIHQVGAADFDNISKILRFLV